MGGQVTRGCDWGDSLRVCGTCRTCRSYVELGGDDCGVARLGRASEFGRGEKRKKNLRKEGMGQYSTRAGRVLARSLANIQHQAARPRRLKSRRNKAGHGGTRNQKYK